MDVGRIRLVYVADRKCDNHEFMIRAQRWPGIDGLVARYEQGRVYHAPGLPGGFEEELLSFPVGAHDDAAG